MRKYYFRHIILLFLITTVITIGCKTNRLISNENFVQLYSEEDQSIASDITVTHIDENDTRIALNINSNELLFVRESSSAPFYANIRINITAFNHNSPKDIIDTTSSVFTISKDSISSEFLAYYVDLNINTGEYAFVRVDVEDINKNRRETHTTLVDKRNAFTSQWFMIMEESDAHFSSYSYSVGDTVVLRYSGQDKENLKVYFYPDSFDIPAPPFSYENITPFKLEPDTVFTPLSIDNKRLTFITDRKGLYFISADPAQQFGFTIFCTRYNFPQILTAADMIPPVRYICSKKEFSRILDNPNKKQAIDDFWIGIGDYEKRAVTLIKKYYSRVIQANKLFSCHTEGWKTDRGMIYIVFGLPNIVYRDQESETWIYGEDKNFFSITFTFKKVENKFSDNDFFLIRTPIYKDNWYRAVDLWRH